MVLFIAIKIPLFLSHIPTSPHLSSLHLFSIRLFLLALVFHNFAKFVLKFQLGGVEIWNSFAIFRWEMEKMNFVKNGVTKLPPGFRFHPTDEELVVQYLRRKVYACPLPASLIPEFDVCKSDPWDLPGDCGQERYFFCTREAKYPNGNRSNRATGSGYWKATGLDKQIISSNKSNYQTQVVVGIKKTLVFYGGKPPHGTRTDWIMHEYRLLPNDATIPQNKINTIQGATEDWVLCRIFLKKRGSKNEKEPTQIQKRARKIEEEPTEVRNCENSITDIRGNKKRVVFYEFLATKNQTDLNVAPVSSSSGSSGVTVVSLHEPHVQEQEEESSSCNSLSAFRKKP